MSTKPKRNNIEYTLLCLLVVYMPFHYWICELFISNTSIDNILRDILILILLFLSFRRAHAKLTKRVSELLINVVILILFAVVSYMIFSYPNTFNILRTYVLPILFGIACTQIRISKEQIKRLLKIFVIELSIIGIWGFIQAFFLGSQFIIRMGYPSQNGFLSGSTSYYINGFWGYQRSVGTFVSPNAFGSVLAVAMCIVLFGQEVVGFKRRSIWTVMLAIGLLATLSRSSILGVVVAWVVITFGIKKKRIRPKTLAIAAGVVAGVIVVVIIADKYYLDGLFSSMIQSSFSGAFVHSDLSTQKHIEDLTAPLAIIFKHPFGRGFGNNGPLALGYSNTALSVESSIYLMMFEVGIIFGALYFVPLVRTITGMNKRKDGIAIISGAVCIAIGITCIILPSTQTYETMFFTFLFVGISLNKNLSRNQIAGVIR